MEGEKKIFFGTFYFTHDKQVQDLFKGMNILTVPYLSVSSMDLKRSGKPETFYKTDDLWLISSSEVYDATKQIEFVNNHLKTDVKIKFTFTEILMKNLIGLTVVAIFFSLVKYMYTFLLN